jgi:hypothetical protein
VLPGAGGDARERRHMTRCGQGTGEPQVHPPQENAPCRRFPTPRPRSTVAPDGRASLLLGSGSHGKHRERVKSRPSLAKGGSFEPRDVAAQLDHPDFRLLLHEGVARHGSAVNERLKISTLPAEPRQLPMILHRPSDDAVFE